ncbi:MAG: hypothetical protein LBP26_00920 [Clostridiales bacterium]|nr:hypothetical protein [Clostridiales bacterium]
MRNFYDENDREGLYVDDDNDDEFSGYSITDASGRSVVSVAQIRADIIEELPAAPPLPDNTMTVMVDGSGALPKKGTLLEIALSNDGGVVTANGETCGTFKPALVKKILVERGGSYIRASVASPDSPRTVKLEFGKRTKKFAVKLPKVTAAPQSSPESPQSTLEPPQNTLESSQNLSGTP